MNTSPDIDLKRPRSALLTGDQIRLLGLFIVFLVFLGVFVSQALDLIETSSRKKANTINFLNTGQSGAPQEDTEDGESTKTVQTGDTSELIDVPIYLALKGEGLKLVKVNRKISRPADKKEMIAKLLEQLQITPDDDKLEATIPEGTELLSIQLKDGVLYLNLNGELTRKGYPATLKSYITLQSLTNTVTSIPTIEKVKFLITDRERLTLHGHFDLKTLWSFDESVVYDK